MGSPRTSRQEEFFIFWYPNQNIKFKRSKFHKRWFLLEILDAKEVEHILPRAKIFRDGRRECDKLAHLIFSKLWFQVLKPISYSNDICSIETDEHRQRSPSKWNCLVHIKGSGLQCFLNILSKMKLLVLLLILQISARHPENVQFYREEAIFDPEKYRKGVYFYTN